MAQLQGVEAKLRLLELAETLGNVKRACEITKFSRDSYYRFRRLYEAGGVAALESRTRRAAAEDQDEAEMPRAVDDDGGRSAPVELGETATSSSQHILKTAFGLFAQRNYAQVTIKDISDATGLNPGLIYYYFGSKEGLFLKVVEMAANNAYESFRTISRSVSAPEDIISTWIVNHARQYPLMRDLIKISIDYANTHSANAEIDAAIRRFYQIEREILRDAISRGVASGRFPAGIDDEKVVTFISTFLDGVLVRSVMFEEFDFSAAIYNLRDYIIHSGLML